MKLFYRKTGDGPPLIIIHGLFGSSDNWMSIAKSLGDSFSVYLPDLRNHGQSPHSDVIDYASMRDDLHELVTDLNIKKFFLAGHSMGGKIATAFALKWPEMLYGLLIADISPFRDEKNNSALSENRNILETMLSVDLSVITSREEVEEILIKKIESGKTRGFILKNLQRTGKNTYEWKINIVSLYNNLPRIVESIDIKSDFPPQVTGFPVTFLRGEYSDYLLPDDFGVIKKIFPAAEFSTITNSGHWVHTDNPGEVVKNIRRLLSES